MLASGTLLTRLTMKKQAVDALALVPLIKGGGLGPEHRAKADEVARLMLKTQPHLAPAEVVPDPELLARYMREEWVANQAKAD